MPQGKPLDTKIYVKARGQGKSQEEAARLAGSKAQNLRKVGCVKEKREGLKPDILAQLEKKRQIAVDKLTGEKISEETAKDLVIIIATLTDKIEFLKGNASDRREFVIRFGTPLGIPRPER